LFPKKSKLKINFVRRWESCERLLCTLFPKKSKSKIDFGHPWFPSSPHQ
jgi:hypothetical protein